MPAPATRARRAIVAHRAAKAAGDDAVAAACLARAQAALDAHLAQCRQRGMSLRAIADVVGVHHRTVGRHLEELDGANATPDIDNAEPGPEPEPLPARPTRAEHITELRAASR